jgi:TonB family protein
MLYMMKKITLSAAFACLLAAAAWAQEPVIYEPLFPGCGAGNSNEVLDCSEMKCMQFIFSNLKHPDAAVQAKVTGVVEVTFNIAIDGMVKDAKISKSLGHGCDEEVLRLLGMMPKWVAGTENGAAKEMQTYLEVKFK